MGPELLDQSAGRSGGKERRQPVLGRAGQYLFLGRSVEARRRRYIDAGSAVRGSSRSQPLRQVRERGVQSTVVGLSVSKQSPRPLVERADAEFGRYVRPGSFSTDSAGIVGWLMSALPQKHRCR